MIAVLTDDTRQRTILFFQRSNKSSQSKNFALFGAWKLAVMDLCHSVCLPPRAHRILLYFAMWFERAQLMSRARPQRYTVDNRCVAHIPHAVQNDRRRNPRDTATRHVRICHGNAESQLSHQGRQCTRTWRVEICHVILVGVQSIVTKVTTGDWDEWLILPTNRVTSFVDDPKNVQEAKCYLPERNIRDVRLTIEFRHVPSCVRRMYT